MASINSKVCVCGTMGSKHCSQCGKQYYCSAECQHSDWKKHKVHCRYEFKNFEYYPQFDGHFWVVKDGEIIDPDFEKEKEVKMLQRCEGGKVYLEASPEVQKDILKMVNDINNFDMCGKFLLKGGFCPGYGQCIFNAMLLKAKFGGKIVFGSMGWKRRGSSSIHWEFGGKDWTVKDFIKRPALKK
jgi:hypothetical protein